ncbi:hypothetical protein [Microbacterium sp.]|uniref:hypothetical protein n=1 Tax=Microbacterium sp. TaxID=51671 RepID=UPI0025E3979E|nr:hypothetical protein [Microbacterium sp.]
MTRVLARAGVVFSVLAPIALAVWGLSLQSATVVGLGVALAAAPLITVLLQRWPQVLISTLGFLVGFAPFATVPGTGTQAIFFLSVPLLVTVLLHPTTSRPLLGPLGIAVVVLVGFSALTAIATYTERGSIVAFGKWAIAAVITVVALMLNDDIRRVLSRSFVYGAAAGGVLALLLIAFDEEGRLLDALSIFGYGGASAVNVRTVTVDGGSVVRATGLYVDPNSAGLFMVFGFAIAGVLFTGARRIVLMAILAAVTVATLSRASIGALMVAGLVLVLLSRLSALSRFGLIVLGAAAAAASFLVPAISSRLFDSFNRSDVGVSARIDAIDRYPEQMAGNWLFGRGWYLREFYDPDYGYQLNHVANTPLMVVYRAGLMAGILFVIVLAIAVVLSVRAMARRIEGAGLLGATLIGIVFVAFQADFPVVTMPPLAMAFGLVLAEVQALQRHPSPAIPPAPVPVIAKPARAVVLA